MFVYRSTEIRTEWRRLRASFGLPSVMIGIGVIFTQSVIELLNRDLPLRLDLIWLGILLTLGLWLFSRFEKSYTASLRRHADDSVTQSSARLQNKHALVAVMGLDSADVTSPLATLLGELQSLEYLVLLGTPETHALGVAQGIVNKLLPVLSLEIDPDHIWIFEQASASSMTDFDLATRQGISWLLHHDIDVADIVCDVTAGKRAMGFGTLLAADRAGVEAQYLTATWDHLAKRPIPGTLAWQIAREVNTPVNS